MNILIVGVPGTGKTWVMKEIIKMYECHTKQRMGMYFWHCAERLYVVGKYDGTMFEGSDRLSMALMRDTDKFLDYVGDSLCIFEGDRFTNSTFIQKAEPIIIKILGDGEEGRKKRNSTQSESHLKRMTTRVANVCAHYEVQDSGEGLAKVNELIQNYGSK
jgi:hypothetical protein